MVDTLTLPLVEAGARWWEAPEYQEGELQLPGPSRLLGPERKLLEEIATRAEKGLLDLPPMPKAAMDAMKVLRTAEPLISDVAKCVQLDPVLTAIVLRHANSALYGPRSVIDTVTKATSYLGLKKMKDLVLGAAMRRVTSDLRSRTFAEMEWRYAIACAVISRALGRHLKLDEEQCYIAGLLHDIGRLPVLQALDQRSVLPPKPSAGCAAEIILESLHRAVGLQVVTAWEQPPSVCDAVTCHLTGRLVDEEDQAQFPSTKVAEAAGDLCIALGLGRFRQAFAILKAPSFVALGFTPESLAAWFEASLPKALSEIKELS